MALTLEALTETIRSRLGGSGRALELKPEDYNTAIGRATKLMARYYPCKGFVVIPVAIPIQKYVVPMPNILGVMDCTFFNNGGRFTYYPYPDADVDHFIIMGQIKQQEKVWGDLPEWDFNWEMVAGVNTPYLYIHFDSDSFLDRAGRIPTHVSLECQWYIQPNDDPVCGLAAVRYDWEEWIENYATACAQLDAGAHPQQVPGHPWPAGGQLAGDRRRRPDRAGARGHRQAGGGHQGASTSDTHLL